MNSFVPHMEILPPSQQTVWPSLSPLRKTGFVLYGGTAVSLRLGHRQSMDFDFFSDRPLDKSGLYKSMPILSDATVIQDTPCLLGVLVSADVSAPTGYVKLFFRYHPNAPCCPGRQGACKEFVGMAQLLNWIGEAQTG